MEDERNFPTMIIPTGTDISVNEHGQLSIKTPGNLVIQNSGSYSLIESGNGSVRVDPGVKVEAVSVQAADSCYVAGELTAWRVKARKITLEKGAMAYIMLQEAEQLELDRTARMVGNFASDRELYLMLGRFSRQLRQLPEGIKPGEEAPPEPFLPRTVEETEEPFVAPDGESDPSDETMQERQEVLSLARVIIERELGQKNLGEQGRAALEELLELVRVGDPEPLSKGYAYLFSQVESGSGDLEHAREMLARLFRSS